MLERESLLAQLAEVAHLLESTPEEMLVERLGLQHRKEVLTAELERLPATARTARAALVFDGKPVVGSVGIDVTFAGSALGTFSKMVEKIHAKKRRTEQLATPGPPPPKAVLHVTDAVHGSFGFELQELQGGLLEGSSLADSLDQAIGLVAASCGEEENFMRQISDYDKVVASSLRDFVSLIHENGATVRLLGAREVSLTSADAHRAAQLTKQVHVTEDVLEYEGIFRGILTVSRTFELELDNRQLIHGAIGSGLTADALVAMHGKRVVATVREVTAEHPGRRHTTHTLVKVVTLEEPADADEAD